MKKGLKKVLIGISIFFIIIFALLILIPILFKDQIQNKVIDIINDNVDAKVEFTDFDLSLISSFPDLSVEIDSLSVACTKEDFLNDTLVAFKSLELDLNLMSVISGDQIKINAIILDSPTINAKVLKGGKANWDIAKETEEKEVEEEKDTSETKFNLGLKKFQIKNANIVYNDEDMAVNAEIKNFNYTLKGDFTQDFTSLQNLINIDAVTVVSENISYLNKAKLMVDADIDADLKNLKFTFKENIIQLNALNLGFDGYVEMPAENIDMDMTFNAKKTDFKHILSLIPAIYMTDFEDIKTSGKLALNGYLKGTYNDNSLPLFGVKLLVENAAFSYPDLPKSVDNINIDIKADSKDKNADNIDIDIKTFHVELAKNPIDVKMFIAMTASDINIKGGIIGNIDLKSISDVIPLDSTEIAGLINADVTLDGKLSSIENEKYEEFKADGNIKVTDLKYKSPDLPQGLNIIETSLIFSPKFIDLSSFNAKIGKSDMQMNGKFENYLTFVFKDELLKGNLNFYSALFDANEFLSDEEVPSTTIEETDTVPLTAFEVPSNIDFTLKSDLQKVIYDKLEIANIIGLIILKDSKVSLNNMSMNLLEGSMKMTGFYDAKDIKTPKADFSLDITDFDIPATFSAFNTIQEIAPIAKHAKGKISAKFSINTTLANDLSPVLNTTSGAGSFSSKNIGIEKSDILNLLASKLKSDKFKSTTLKNIKVGFAIKDGNIIIDPFKVNIAGNETEIQGIQGIDQTINYTMKTKFPAAKASAVIGKLSNTNVKDKIDIGINIGGTLSNPKITKVTSSAIDDVKEQITEKIEEKKEELKKEVSAQVKKIIEDADKEAKKIMDEAKLKSKELQKNAKSAGEEIITEADKQGDDIIKEAGNNPLLKKAAKRSAKKLHDEAVKKSDKLNKEAENTSKAIQDKAKLESDKIISDARKQADKIENL